MENSIAPLDEETIQIRQLIMGFELCYHEADKEAEYIAKAIGAGRCPKCSNERPPQRKKELENFQQILSSWCKDPTVSNINLDIGGISADVIKLRNCKNVFFLGQKSYNEVPHYGKMFDVAIMPWSS